MEFLKRQFLKITAKLFGLGKEAVASLWHLLRKKGTRIALEIAKEALPLVIRAAQMTAEDLGLSGDADNRAVNAARREFVFDQVEGVARRQISEELRGNQIYLGIEMALEQWRGKEAAP